MDPFEIKQKEEERLKKSIEEKNREIEQKTKDVAIFTNAALKAIEKIKNLILEAQQEYLQQLRSTERIKRI